MNVMTQTQIAEIQCINKRDRYDRYSSITHVGGVHNGQYWHITQDDAISHIENRVWDFYTNVRGHRARVVVEKSIFGNKYLKTEADQGTENNLLSLPECPW